MVGGFSPGTPASSTTKTGRHDIAEILLKVALSTKNQPYHRILYMSNTMIAIVLSVLRFTASDYPFVIFKLFFHVMSVYQRLHDM